MVEYLRRPEKFVRLNVRMLRELAAATAGGGLRALADLVAQPMPGPVGNLMRQRLRAPGNEIDNPPALPPTAAPRTPWNRSDHAPPPLRLHHRRRWTTPSR